MESHHTSTRSGRAVWLLAGAALLVAGCAEDPGYTNSNTVEYDQYGRPVYTQPYPGQPTYTQGYPGQPVYSTPAQTYPYGPTGYSATDYLYYPDDEVYYSPWRREYLYRDGGGWTRSYQPPRYLNGSDFSVHLNFGDDPVRHHREVERRYPGHRRDWDGDRDRR